MLYIIACVLEIVVCVVSLFVPTVYTYDYASARIKGVGSIYNRTGASQLTLMSHFGGVYIALIGVVVIATVIYLVFFLLKKSGQIPQFVLLLVYALPMIMVFVAQSQSVKSGAATVGNTTVVVGRHSGLNTYGWLLLVVELLVFGLTIWALFKQRNELANSENSKVKTIKRLAERAVKDKKYSQSNKDDIDPDDWV